MTKHNNKLMVECVGAHQFCPDGARLWVGARGKISPYVDYTLP